jgi:hypothetical protein
MEPLWSPVVATGRNRSQTRRPRRPRKQAKTVALGCHPLRAKFHGKGRVDATSLLLKRGSLPSLCKESNRARERPRDFSGIQHEACTRTLRRTAAPTATDCADTLRPAASSAYPATRRSRPPKLRGAYADRGGQPERQRRRPLLPRRADLRHCRPASLLLLCRQAGRVRRDRCRKRRPRRCHRRRRRAVRGDRASRDPRYGRRHRSQSGDARASRRRKLAVLQGNRYGRGGERRADVRPRIAVAHVGVSPLPRLVDQPFKRRLDFCGDFARARALAWRTMPAVVCGTKSTTARPFSSFSASRTLCRNVDKLCAAVGMHDERPHRRGQRTLSS